MANSEKPMFLERTQDRSRVIGVFLLLDGVKV